MVTDRLSSAQVANTSCPSLTDLPPPPSGRVGWPWTVETRRLPPTLPDGAAWPRVSVVTPSYNQVQFIEETIRSVLLQACPRLEYTVIDGASDDGSVNVIRKYERWISYWASEPDHGQGHAINKGLARASGDVVAWVNSDDMLTPGSITRAVGALRENPGVDVVYSDFDDLNERSGQLTRRKARPAEYAKLLRDGNCIPQPTAFVRRSLLERIGPIDETLYHALDWELWIRAARHGRLLYLPGTSLAILRDQPLAKTRARSSTRAPEFLKLLDRIYADPSLPEAARRVKRAAYARVYWIAAEAATSEGHASEGMTWLIRSLLTHPRPTMLRPLMTLRLILQAAKPALRA
jgi:glycosyltransferase involved in cell wall biosynthesis